MDFRTEMQVKPAGFRICHADKILLLGSCFSQNINSKLQYHGFDSRNPFGALYSPLSILSSLELLHTKENYDISKLFYQNEAWHSYDFHSDYSDPDKAKCLEKINRCIEQGRFYLKNANLAFISLGTSFCYKLKSSGKTVANCHKSPANDFERFFLNQEDCIRTLLDIADSLPNANIVFTVSPIRHIRDGLHANQLSKSNLLLAIDNVCSKNTRCSYFPSYEIVMDDLRDYRYYASDMVHLSDIAIDYIWEKFSDCYFSEETKNINKKVSALRMMQNHKITNPTSKASKNLLTKIDDTISNLKQQYKELHL